MRQPNAAFIAMYKARPNSKAATARMPGRRVAMQNGQPYHVTKGYRPNRPVHGAFNIAVPPQDMRNVKIAAERAVVAERNHPRYVKPSA
jgi:hypothetical protein